MGWLLTAVTRTGCQERELQPAVFLPTVGLAVDGGGVADGREGGEDVNSGADLLLAALEGSRAALAAAEARAAALAADKAALEGQLAAERGAREVAAREWDRERERVEAMEGQLGRERDAREAAEREREAALQQLGRERERAAAAEAQVRHILAGVVRRVRLAAGGGPAVRQPKPQPARAPGTPA